MSDRPVLPGRRLNPTYKSQSKYVTKNPNEDQEKAQRLALLEKQRAQLFALISKFTNKLSSKTLHDTLSIKEREEQHVLPQLLIEEAQKLNELNLDEGSNVLFAVFLHTILKQKDENNLINYKLHLLGEEIKKLKNECK